MRWSAKLACLGVGRATSRVPKSSLITSRGNLSTTRSFCHHSGLSGLDIMPHLLLIIWGNVYKCLLSFSGTGRDCLVPMSSVGCQKLPHDVLLVLRTIDNVAARHQHPTHSKKVMRETTRCGKGHCVRHVAHLPCCKKARKE